MSCISDTIEENKSKQISEMDTIHSIDTNRIAVININSTILNKTGRIHADLSDQNYDQIDSLLRSEIAEYNDHQKLEINLDQYTRQYVVYKNDKGEKVAWINCMCGAPMSDEWRQGLIIVSDGGNCFFQVSINLTLNRVTEFSVNGEA